jgi:hypothetical protein
VGAGLSGSGAKRERTEGGFGWSARGLCACERDCEPACVRACQAWERGKSGEVLGAHIEESAVEFSHEWKMDCRLPAEADL